MLIYIYIDKVEFINISMYLIFSGPKAAKILVYEYVTNGSLLDYIIGN